VEFRISLNAINGKFHRGSTEKNVYLGQYKTEEEAREVLTKFREKRYDFRMRKTHTKKRS